MTINLRLGTQPAQQFMQQGAANIVGGMNTMQQNSMREEQLASQLKKKQEEDALNQFLQGANLQDKGFQIVKSGDGGEKQIVGIGEIMNQQSEGLSNYYLERTPEYRERQRLAEQNRMKQEERQQKEFDFEREKFEKRLELDRKKIEQQSKKLAEKTSKKPIPKSTQFQAGTFAARIEQAENSFDDLLNRGYDPTSTERRFLGLLPGEVKPEFQQRQEQAERNFVNAVLRRESGAAIAPEEFVSAEKQYFPRPGDTADTVEQKRRNRQIVFAGLKAESGEAYPMIQQQFQQQFGGLQQRAPQQQQQIPVSGLTPEQRRQRILELRAKAGQ